MDVTVKIRNLSVWYGQQKALETVSITVPKGSVYAILGPSGCGKSTLLRTVNKLILLRDGAKVEGNVEVFGVDVYNSNSLSDEVLAKVGMVFQTPNPFPHLSIYDNVAIGPKLRGQAKGKELDKLVRWALEKSGLWDEVKDRLSRPASELSGGQQQRLCIARALAIKPSLLLMDEPTANLDPLNAAKIEELIKELSGEITIMLVTHDADQARRLASSGALLFLGKVVCEGPIDSIINGSYCDLLQNLVSEHLTTQTSKTKSKEIKKRG
ncbi:MAG: phosphate ABC transporter ATP-binding protein [Thermofilaceae archaeon]|nr:phosphate ABC transporter ATP-binding protein [Thermofilaceae archaeon]